jgi:hypothetical protein
MGGPRAYLGSVWKIKISFPYRELNPLFPVVQPPAVVTSVTELSGCRNISRVLHGKCALYAPSLENHYLKLHAETGVKHYANMWVFAHVPRECLKPVACFISALLWSGVVLTHNSLLTKQEFPTWDTTAILNPSLLPFKWKGPITNCNSNFL